MRDVAITGLGILSALGRGGAAHLEALRAGRSGLGRLTLFEAPGVPESPVGEVAAELFAGEERVSRSEALALAAARDALGGFAPSGEGAVVVGTTTGGIFESEEHYLKHRGQEGVGDRALLRHHPAGSIADRLSSRLSLEGERHTFSTACSSSANSIGYGASLVAAGAPWALAGGVDSLCRLTYSGFYALKLLSASPCRPFDARRNGLSLGEGAAFLLLEPAAAARARGATVLGYVAGWGTSADAHHATAPHPEGKGAIAAMQAALADACVSAGEVSYVNAHGTATPANDKAEALALRSVFGTLAPPVSSTKGATGHTLGAAGAIEAALCALCLNEGFAPPTVGLGEPDPGLEVRHVPSAGLALPPGVALSNSFGFGGNNAALVLRGAR
ncbi:MAG: beta-ketoacyl-[acyl-carrier-protein] synthase family protein [Myxococcaceae bacterium]